MAGFTLDASAIDGAPVEREGHVHYYLDGVLEGDTAADDLYIALTTGEHALEVRLAGNDHVELPISDQVRVEALQPSILLTPPWNASALPGSSADLGVAISDFLVDADVGGPTFGEGFYTLSVDGVRTGAGIDPLAAAVTRIPAGTHAVQAELVHGDGSPLSPPVLSNTLDLTVVEGAPFVALQGAPGSEEPHGSASLDLLVATTNFPLGEGAGGWHLYVDGAFARAGHEPGAVVTHLSPGLHLVEVRLVEGAELPVRDVQPVRVAEGRPDVTITWPGESWGINNGFSLTFVVENFEMNAAFPGAHVEGQGHVELIVDGVSAGQMAGASVPMSLSPGEHTVRLRLVQNDGIPVEPPVVDQVTFTVR